MENPETITINGKTYKLVDPNAKGIQPPVETDHVIIIAQRGWIFEGRKNKAVTDKIQLLNANIVRQWSNDRGIGGLCRKATKDEYILDEVSGAVLFEKEAIIAMIDITEW